MNRHLEVFRATRNLVNLYAQPNSDSELVSQALLNDRLEAREQNNGFYFVIGDDNYSGWVDKRHLLVETDQASPNVQVVALTTNLLSGPYQSAELISKVVLSSKLFRIEQKPGSEFSAVVLPDSTNGWVLNSDLRDLDSGRFKDWENGDLTKRSQTIQQLGVDVFAQAMRLIGVPYLWGGCSPFGIDCSALVQLAFKLEGLQLLRDADLQFGDRRFLPIETKAGLGSATLQTGDLVFFGNQTSGLDQACAIDHVGIASGDGRFLHASGRKCNFGTYFNLCSDSIWAEKFVGATRLSEHTKLSLDQA